jgi:hemerythrin
MTDFDCTPQVDLEFMNAEHRKAFDDANEIKRLLEAAKTDLKSVEKSIDQQLEQFQADTINHFYLEEKYMEEYQFPARLKHQQAHHQFLERFKVQYEYWHSKRDLTAVERLEHYFTEDFSKWLINHIVTIDTVTASYIARHGGTDL